MHIIAREMSHWKKLGADGENQVNQLVDVFALTQEDRSGLFYSGGRVRSWRCRNPLVGDVEMQNFSQRPPSRLKGTGTRTGTGLEVLFGGEEERGPEFN